MFEPRIYKKNGLEAFRLVGSDGSEFFYEGVIDCDEKALYKDNLGRLYYPVTSRVGGPINYFVELDPQVQHIPFDEEGRREKDISRLVNASPRLGASLPDDIYVVPETTEAIPLEEAAPNAATPNTAATNTEAPEKAQEETSEKPPEEQLVTAPESQDAKPAMPVPEAPVMKPEASDAIHAIFTPKVDTSHPPTEQKEKVAVAEKAEPPAPTPEPVKAAKKKRSLKWPLAIFAIVILLAACAIGVYVVRPHAYDGLRALYTHPTATPEPTPVPTEAPTPTPTPTPEPSNSNMPTAEFSALIDSNSSAVTAFVQNNTNGTSRGNSFRQTCDLFDYVNAHWKISENFTSQRNASEITATLEGTSEDYTILVCALVQAAGAESRPVFSYIGDDLRYYPEVLASNTSAGYQTALQELHTRYGNVTPAGHSDDSGYWISLDMGSYPGIRPSSPTAEYTLYNGQISPINLKA